MCQNGPPPPPLEHFYTGAHQQLSIEGTLPPHLYPHTFLYLSVTLAIVLGILNIFTLAMTVPAIIVGNLVSVLQHQSRAHINYSWGGNNYARGRGPGVWVPGLVLCMIWSSKLY